MAILRWIVALPFVAGAVIFALAHRDAVAVTWSPFHPAVYVPLYIVALGFLAAGFLFGVLAAWIGMRSVRRDRRALRKQVRKLEKDMAANENITPTAFSGISSTVPLLTQDKNSG